MLRGTPSLITQGSTAEEKRKSVITSQYCFSAEESKYSWRWQHFFFNEVPFFIFLLISESSEAKTNNPRYSFYHSLCA